VADFNETNVCDPQWIAADEEDEQAQAVWDVSVDAASDVAGRPVGWVVQNIVADEAVTVIAGEPGAGKTFFGCKLAADVARVLPCRVVLATSGQEPPELLRWRLDQTQADSRRVALVSLTPKRFTERRAGPSERAIDDVDGWFGRPGQCLSAATLARVIQHLNQLARSLRVAVVVLLRAPMSADGRLTSQQLGRLSQSASVVWLLVKDREQGVTGWHALRYSEGRGELSIAFGAAGENAESPTQPPVRVRGGGCCR
jgi:hypothetical protein